MENICGSLVANRARAGVAGSSGFWKVKKKKETKDELWFLVRPPHRINTFKIAVTHTLTGNGQQQQQQHIRFIYWAHFKGKRLTWCVTELDQLQTSFDTYTHTMSNWWLNLSQKPEKISRPWGVIVAEIVSVPQCRSCYWEDKYHVEYTPGRRRK